MAQIGADVFLAFYLRSSVLESADDVFSYSSPASLRGFIEKRRIECFLNATIACSLLINPPSFDSY
jgi:hypothetical protein